MSMHHLDGNPHNNSPANLRQIAPSKRRAVTFEWDVETLARDPVDDDREILDHSHYTRLADIPVTVYLEALMEEDRRLVLLHHDSWGRWEAYVEKRQLPSHFGDKMDHHKVPKRFHEELEQAGLTEFQIAVKRAAKLGELLKKYPEGKIPARGLTRR